MSKIAPGIASPMRDPTMNPSRCAPRFLRGIAFAALSLSCLAGGAWADPDGGEVVAGQASISEDGAETTIRQMSDRAVINWRGFDIDVNELVRFIQPGRDSVALNRVLGSDPTTILGQLTANGRVFLVNPNGVIFGPSAKVDMAGLLATTFDIRDDDFLRGKYEFLQKAGIDPSFVVNQGEIKVADNGFCFLVAPGVKNEGLIIAQIGKVVLGAGDRLTLDLNGDGLVTYELSGKGVEAIQGPDGEPLSSVVENSGRILNPGGHVVLAGDVASAAMTSVVNNDGVIEARSLVNHGGVIVLEAGEGGIASNRGGMDVSAAEAGARAGEVRIAGEFAGHFGTISARGAEQAPGGRVTIDSTTHTLAGSGSTIDVSGGADSSAGSVLLDSRNRTTFNGGVTARGGALGGDGGFVEISSAGQVELNGLVDASAPNGRTGILLIDPKNVDINDAGGVPYAPGVNNLFTNNAAGNTVLAAGGGGGINSQVADVVVQANTDITVTTAVSIANAGTALTLQAGRSVNINNSITTNNGIITITANDSTADLLNRDAGTGEVLMSAGTAINAGTAAVNLTIDGAGPTPGGITLDSLTSAGTVTLNSFGDIVEAGAGDAGSDITAGTLNITVTNAGDTIGLAPPAPAASNPLEITVAALLNATTSDGNIALSHTAGNLALGSLDAGTETIVLDVVNGAVTDGTGAGAENLIAGAINLTTSGATGGAIGTVVAPIRTAVGILTASTSNGGLYFTETDAVLVNNILSREGGFTPYLDGSNQVVINSAAPVPGTFDVSLTSSGDVILGTVTSPNAFTLNAGTGMILDQNAGTGNILAQTMNLTGASIGTSADPIETTIETLTAAGTAGGVFLQQGVGGTVTSITAAGAGNDVVMSNVMNALRLGTITAAGGSVTIENLSGTLIDDNAGAVNITSQSLTITASAGVGTSADPIDTTVDDITATATDSGAVVQIAETDGLNSVNVKTRDGDASVTFTGGPLTFTAGTDVLTASGAAITFENTNGDVALGTVNAAAAAVSITASAAIRDDVNDAVTDITAGTATLHAETFIGAAGNEIDTAIATLTATADAGGVYLREADGMTLTATATGAGNDVDAGNLAGDLTIGKVTAADQVLLNALVGSILASTPGSLCISGGSATLSAGTAIGTGASPLKTSLTTLTNATSAAGGVFLNNIKALTLTSATATGGDLTLTTSGDLALGAVTAAGQTVTLTATGGAITDNNAGAVNITAATANVTGESVGAGGAEIDTLVDTLGGSTTSGGFYIRDTNPATLTVTTVTAAGSDADVDIGGAADIVLGSVTALGDDVVLTAVGAITDGNAGTANVSAKTLTITAPGGIGTPGDTLEINVDSLTADGGAGATGTSISSTGTLALTEASLQQGGSYSAATLTLLDIGDDLALVAGGRSLTLTTSAGNIVSLDRNDRLQTTGAGTLTIRAGTTLGSGGAAVLGDLETAGQDIMISADSHITIGLVNAGAGNVTIQSAAGQVVDGNGVALNIIANNLTISGVSPTTRQAELRTMTTIADASALNSEAAAKESSYLAFSTAAAMMIAAHTYWESQVDLHEEDVADKEDLALAAQIFALAASTAKSISDGALLSANLTAAATFVAAAPPQASPTGDGGALSAASAPNTFKEVTSNANTALTVADVIAGLLSAEADTNLAQARAELYATEVTRDLAQQTRDAFQESTSITKAAWEKAVIAADHAEAIRDQAIAAEDAVDVVGSSSQALGVQLTGLLDITAGQSSINLAATGTVNLNTISATNTAGTADAKISSTGDINLVGVTTVSDRLRLDSIGGSILQAGGSITGGELVAVATAGIGSGGGGPLQTTISRLSADGGTGGVNLVDTTALNVTTLDGVTGVTATAGDVTLDAGGDLTLTSRIDASAGAQTVTLLSTGAIVDGNAATSNITSDVLAMTAANGIGTLADPVETTVNRLEAGVTTGGDIAIAITAATLTIGGVTGALTGVDTVSAGTIQLTTSGALDVSTAGEDLSTAAAGTIAVQAAGHITGAAGATSMTTGTLTVNASTAGATIDAGGAPLEIAAGTLTATTGAAGAAGGLINISDVAGGLTLAGATTNTGAATLDVSTVGALSVTGAVNSAGAVSLTADDSGAAGDDLTVQAGVTVQSTGSTVALTAGDSISTVAGSNVTAAGLLTLDANGLGDGAGDGVTGVLTLAGNATGNGGAITGGGLTQAGLITSTGAVDITTVSSATSAVDGILLGPISAAGQTVTLSATGTATASILDNNAGTTNVTSAGLAMTSSGGLGTALDPLDTVISNLEAGVTSGSLFISNTSGILTIGGVTGALSGVDTGSAGTIQLTTSGALTISTAGENVTTAAGGIIGLTAAGTVTLTNGAVDAGTTGTTTITTTAGNIVGASGAANITSGTLTLTDLAAGGRIGDALTALEIDAVNVAITTGAVGVAGGRVNVHDTTGGVTVTGATTNAGGVPLTIASADGLTIGGAVNSAGAVLLVADNSAAAGDDITVLGGATVQSTGSTVTLTAGDNVVTNVLSSLTAAGLLTITSDNAGDGAGDGVTGAITLDGTATGVGVTLTGGGLAQTGLITSTGAVNITTVSAATSPIDGILLGPISAAGQTVTISATGTATSSIDDNNGGTTNVTAANLALTATAGIGSALDAIETTVDRLAASGGTGGVFIDNSGSLTLQTVSGVTSLGATGGAITLTTTGDLSISDGFVQGAGLTVGLTATSGNILETSAGAAADVVGATINLTSTGAGNTIGLGSETLEINATTALNATTANGDMFLNDTTGGLGLGLVDAGTAGVTLTATGGSLTDAAGDAAADLVASTANLTVTGAGSTIGTGGNALELDVTTLNALTVGGSMFIEDTAGGVGAGLIDAGSGDVTLTATGGRITDAAGDAAADIVGATLNLTVTGAAGTIGTGADALELNATTALNALTAGGSLFVNDTAGGVAVGLVDAGAGSVTLIAIGGSITDAAGDAAADIVGNVLSLNVTGGASTIGTAADDLDVDATTLNAATEGGSIYITDTAGGVAVDLITTTGAAGSTVELTALNGSIIEAAPSDAATDILAGTVDLTVTGAGSSIGVPGDPLEIEATTLSTGTGGGSVTLGDMTGDIILELMDTGGGPGTVITLSTSGNIIEGTSDAGPDLIAETINLFVTGGGSTIGTSTETVEIDATFLNAGTTGGSIYLNDVAGGVSVGSISTTTLGTSSVNLTATGGSITNGSDDSAPDIESGTINLAVTGGASTIGTATDFLVLDAITQLNATTEGGSLFLSDSSGGVGVGLLDAGVGDVFLSSTSGLIRDTNGIGVNNIVGMRLGLSSSNGIGEEDSLLDTTVGFLEAESMYGGVYIRNQGALAIGGVTDALAGIRAVGHGDVVLVALSPIVVNESIVNLSGGAIRLTAGSSLESDDITLNAGLTASGGNGNITLTAGDSVNQNGNITASGTGDVSLTALEGSITMGAGTVTSVVNGDVDYSALGRIAVAGIVAAPSSGEGGHVSLVAPGGVVQVNPSVPAVNANSVTVQTTAPLSADDVTRLVGRGDPSDIVLSNNRLLGGSIMNEFTQAQSVLVFDRPGARRGSLLALVSELLYGPESGLISVDEERPSEEKKKAEGKK